MKHILITNGQVALNQEMARHLLGRGHEVALLCPSDCEMRVPEEHSGRLHHFFQDTFEANALREQLNLIVDSLGGLDVLVHGHEMVDEAERLAVNVQSFSTQLAEHSRRIFATTRAVVSHLIRQKGGAIVFPVIFDALYYDGYAVSPVLDHGKLSMMKCLAHELTSFHIQVNALSLGYYDPGFDRTETKQRQNVLSIYGLKPPIARMDQLLTALDILVTPPCSYISGQNIHVGMGTETTV